MLFSLIVVLPSFIIKSMDFIFTEKGFIQDGKNEEFAPSSFYDYCFRELEKGASITEEYIKEIASFFIDNLLSSTGIELEREKIEPEYEKEELDRIAGEVPFAPGSRYVDRKWVKRQLDVLLECYRKEISTFSQSVDIYFNMKNESLLFPSRIYFHLVEDKDTSYPFAFMATYTTKDEDGAVHHYPLRFALTEYKDDLEGLSRLISPISRLSSSSDIIKGLVSSGRIFYPVRFTEEEAYDFLSHAQDFESEGIECRIPNFWRKKGRYSSLGRQQRQHGTRDDNLHKASDGLRRRCDNKGGSSAPSGRQGGACLPQGALGRPRQGQAQGSSRELGPLLRAYERSGPREVFLGNKEDEGEDSILRPQLAREAGRCRVA